MKENTKSVYKVVSIGILCSAMLLLGMTSMDTSAQISPTYVASGIIYDEEVDYWNISNVNKGNLFLLTIQAETGLSSWESRLSYLNLTEIDKIVKADTHIYEFIANETGCYLLRLYTPSPTVNYTINCSHEIAQIQMYVASGVIYDEEVKYKWIYNVDEGDLFLLTIQAETGLSSWESRLSYLNLTEIDKIVKADTHIYEFIANETGCYLLRLYTPSPTVNYTINCSHPVRIQGDLDDDGDVDFDDIVAIAMAYGSKPGAPNWDVDADLDCDGDVDFDDVVTAAMNYGKRDC